MGRGASSLDHCASNAGSCAWPSGLLQNTRQWFFAKLPPRPASYHTVYIEARNVKPDFRAPGPNLSPADQQNGIERKGAFYFYSQTYREISIGKDGTRDQWSEWRNGTALSSVHLTYRHGAWEIVEQQPVGIDAIGRFARVRQPACSEAAS